MTNYNTTFNSTFNSHNVSNAVSMRQNKKQRINQIKLLMMISLIKMYKSAYKKHKQKNVSC